MKLLGYLFVLSGNFLVATVGHEAGGAPVGGARRDREARQGLFRDIWKVYYTSGNFSFMM